MKLNLSGENMIPQNIIDDLSTTQAGLDELKSIKGKDFYVVYSAGNHQHAVAGFDTENQLIDDLVVNAEDPSPFDPLIVVSNGKVQNIEVKTLVFLTQKER